MQNSRPGDISGRPAAAETGQVRVLAERWLGEFRAAGIAFIADYLGRSREAGGALAPSELWGDFVVVQMEKETRGKSLFQGFEPSQGRTTILSYLFVCLENFLKDKLRDAKRHPAPVPIQHAAGVVAPSGSSGGNPLQAILSQEWLAHGRALLDLFDRGLENERDRQIYRRIIRGSAPPDQVAAALGISKDSLAKRKGEILAALKFFGYCVSHPTAGPLTPDQHRVLLLTVLGETLAEVAAKMGIPKEAGKRLHVECSGVLRSGMLPVPFTLPDNEKTPPTAQRAAGGEGVKS